jgi:hypothetical protein
MKTYKNKLLGYNIIEEEVSQVIQKMVKDGYAEFLGYQWREDRMQPVYKFDQGVFVYKMLRLKQNETKMPIK